MNDLIVSLTDEEKGLIANELDKLFSAQDRPMTKEKKAVFVQELSVMNIPAGAIIHGIRNLLTEDLKAIKLATIRDEAMKFVANRFEESRSQCEDCRGSGYVPMKDGDLRWFTLGCRCLNGEHVASRLGVARWSGEDSQFVNGRALTRFGWA